MYLKTYDKNLERGNNMISKKKFISAILAISIVAALAVGGTLAYLTSVTDTVTNTFTVGDVEITMDEQKVTEAGVADGTTRQTTNSYKLMPGHPYIKDPTIHVTNNKEDCYLFVKINNTISSLLITENTTIGETTYKSIADQLTENHWELVSGTTDIYQYVGTNGNAVVSAGTDVVVFNNFVVKSNADVSGVTANDKIELVACAVQADGLTLAQAYSEATFGTSSVTP